MILLPAFTAGQAPTALLAGLLFAVHPVHVEAVAGIVGRADILGTLFATLAFCAYRCARHAAGVSRAMAWLAVYACLCWCAALSKEVALTVLGICVVHEVAFCAWANPWCPVPASLWPVLPITPPTRLHLWGLYAASAPSSFFQTRTEHSVSSRVPSVYT